jgi:PAS domain S-box-containing protein
MSIYNPELNDWTVPEATELVLITNYYLTKLLQANFNAIVSDHPLTQVIDLNSFTQPNSASTLEWLLSHLYSDPQHRHEIILQLEQLTLSHQTLSSQGGKYRQELRETEEQILRLLGFRLGEMVPKRTVLIVDDTPDNLRLLAATLVEHGYEVSSAINGGVALKRVQTIQPDLILLDIMMPGIDGYEVCERLKTNLVTRSIPVIFLSAIDDGIDKVKAFNVGGADYITKPFQLEEVLVRIEHQINLREQQKQVEAESRSLQQAVQNYRQAEECYRHFFEQAVDGMFQATPDGRFLKVNQSLARLCGYESPAALTESMSNVTQQFYVRPQRQTELIAYLQQYEGIADFESEIHCQDGSTRWVSESLRAVKDNSGNLLYYEGTVKEITKRKQAESAASRRCFQLEKMFLSVILYTLSVCGRNW